MSIRAALIDSSISNGPNVVNVVMLENADDPIAPGFIAVPSDEASKGWTYTNGVFTAPPQALSVPSSISDRQFAQGLATWSGFPQKPITQAEALAWVKVGTLPAAMQGFVDSLSTDQAFAANMLLSGATIFERSHPMVETFGQALGMDSSAIDAFWIFCSEL